MNDPLAAMFAWWNAAFARPEGFTPDALARFFTDEATMRINGVERARGLDGLAARFRTVQAQCDRVTVRLPFLAGFVSADGREAYTCHLVDAVAGGRMLRERVAGHARLVDRRIALLDFVSVEERLDRPAT